MAKTAAERKREQREREKSATNVGRLDVTCHIETVTRIGQYADFYGMTQSEVIEKAMAMLWGTLSPDELQAIARHADARAQLKLQRKAGDIHTLDLFRKSGS